MLMILKCDNKAKNFSRMNERTSKATSLYLIFKIKAVPHIWKARNRCKRAYRLEPQRAAEHEGYFVKITREPELSALKFPGTSRLQALRPATLLLPFSIF